MKQYSVYGMSCAACSARVEKAVSKVAGVESVSVSLLTNSMGVEGNAEPDEIIKAVENAGYKAELKNSPALKNNSDSDNTNSIYKSTGREDELDNSKETNTIKNRLIWSLLFLIPLMYISMGHAMWGWPLPAAWEQNYVALGMTQMLFTIVVMIINKKFFINGIRGAIHLAPNMDTLVALGAGASFGYSLYVLYAMTFAQISGNVEMLHRYMHDLYFESAAMILTLITVGKMLESYSKGRTTDALKSLMRLSPQSATILDSSGNEITVDIESVKIGDTFIVKPGESIPVDGVILEGMGAIDESALTGESIPRDVKVEDTVSASTINRSGYLKCRATRVGEDTTISQIINMVSDAAATKAPIAKVADKVSGVFVPAVILISIITIIVWLAAGEEVGFALARGIAVLVISCPCALGLATPVAIMVGNGIAARNGVLFKNAVSLENTGKVDIVALDKTGTITSGKPEVTDIIAEEDTRGQLLEIAYGLEAKSEHPLAYAVVEYGKAENIKRENITEFEIEAGHGLKGRLHNCVVAGGNIEYISKFATADKKILAVADKLAQEGKTPLFFSKDNKILGIIAVADVIKDDSRDAIEELKSMGIKVVMLTGDNEVTANAIGNAAGVDEVYAGILPQGKEEIVRKLSEEGRVAMVGDGINDAPALTRADIGIAIGAGTDVARDAASVVLMKNSLQDVVTAIRLSKKVLKNIHENLFWAFFYNVIGIPLAAGVWYPLMGWKLNPMFGAAAMSFSSVCVVTNALRLNMFQIRRKSQFKREKAVDNKKNINEKEQNNTMKKTIFITGMMCVHCEARVKKILEALPQVKEAVVSHENGTAILELMEDVPNEELKKIIEAQEYVVDNIE